MARGRSQDEQLEPEIERLYALPAAAFTAARNELAARLRQEGRRDAAAKVKALPRPTPSSWAVSRLMRLEPARFRALLDAGKQARQAQARALRDGAGGPAAQLREALAVARLAVEELRRRGLELLAAPGKSPSAKAADQLTANLQALAFTAGAESAIARGWLDRDLEAPGFEVLAGLQAAAGRGAAPAAAAARRPGRDERTRREQARLEQVEQARERGRARLAEAEAEVERAAEESARLTAAAAAAERAAADARRRADEAQGEAERSRRDAERASRLLALARMRLDAARSAVGTADRLISSSAGAGRQRADEPR
jgi:hypothetical protein